LLCFGNCSVYCRKSGYREFAAANPGDAAAGKSVFEDASKAACVKCHSIDGSRRGVGPDLGSIGNKFERPSLIQSILDPSSSIAIGYGITIVVTESGQAYQGVLQRVTDDFLELKDKDSKTVRVETRTIEEQRESSTSLMPERIETLISQQEFADLVAYLETLKHSIWPLDFPT
jgi:quinoprotein glucose dehydrogenase